MSSQPTYNILQRLERMDRRRALQIRKNFIRNYNSNAQTWYNYIYGRTDITGKALKIFADLFQVRVDELYSVNNPKIEL